jgi:modulator of FtsH protease
MPPFTPTLAAWQPFFAAQLGAGAALLGLLFVGLSLNLSRILAIPSLPLRAEISLMLLALQLVICSVMLIPDQGTTSAGIEDLVIAGIIWLATTTIGIRILRAAPRTERLHGWWNLGFLQLATLPYLAGGVMLLLGSPHGLHVVAIGMILSFLKAGLDAWVLLVEINR